ncbi:MAG: imidazoleglycerol-phosphate dehydratase [Methanothrix sp.]|jgi:imidazoleglycerol-phosphate dehydratase|nr:imidazoleglycerol-phosphate dehydratase [Methanothrix sp.]
MSASRKRETKETSIEVILETEGSGIIQIDTEIELLDEILSAIARGAGFDLTVKARGDLETGDHHTTEDTAITLGCTLAEVIKSGIGSCMVPSGLALATAAVRFGEPGYQGNFVLQSQALSGMSLENFSHFLRALAYNGRFNLFISAEGGDDRSKIEAMSTALGRAIKKAARDH